MKPNGKHLNRFRVDVPMPSPSDALFGGFVIRLKTGVKVFAMSSGEAHGTTGVDAWEHVSVSLPDRCPTWEEMCEIKDLFWKATETVVQFHPPKTSYVNNHPYCLHLWRHVDQEVNLPPIQAV